MPVAFGLSGTILRPTSNLLVAAPGTGTWTVLVWFRLRVVTGTQVLWYLNDGHALRVSGTSLQFYYGSGADTITTVAADTWYCVTVTKNGTTEARYTVDGVYASNRTTSLSNSDVANAYVGSWGGSTDWLNGATIGPVKAWDRVLTANEIALEGQRWLPEFTDSLRLFCPLLRGAPNYLDPGGYFADYSDYSGNGRPLLRGAGSMSSAMHSGPPIPWGSATLTMAEDIGASTAAVVTYASAGHMTLTAPGVTVTGGAALTDPLIELAYDAALDNRYSSFIPASRIRAVSGGTGFKGLRKHLSDNAVVDIELRNDDGAYTTGGGLWIGMWCKVRLAGSGEVLFTGRVTALTPAYGVNNPYVNVTLETSRNDLSIPANSVLLSDTDVEEAALALLDGLDLGNSGGLFIFDYSLFDGPDLLAPEGSEQVRTYGSQWLTLAAAGGYGKADGELNVINAMTELMKAEDGRAVWAADGMLELYSRTYLDNLRDGELTYTLTDDEIVSLGFSIGSEYVNDLTLNWAPTRWQAGAVVYTYEADSPASIQPSEYRDFSVRFRGEGSDRVLAAENIAVVITQTGPTVSYVWPGGIKATGGTLRVTNPGGANKSEAASITEISVTGDALIQSDKAEVRLQENFGKTMYGIRPLVITTMIDRETEAVARAQREFAAWNERTTYAGQVDLKPRTRAEALQWITLPFATPMGVQSDRLAHNARYLSIGCDWHIGEGGRPVDVTLYLEPVVTGGLFTFDDDDKGFDIGRLA